MIIYLYGRYISDDKERLEERISEDIACNVKNIASVEILSESAYEDIEEIEVNAQAIFRFMKEAYIFLAHCGTE